MIVAVIQNDDLHVYEKTKRMDAEYCILTAAKIIAPLIEDTFSIGPSRLLVFNTSIYVYFCYFHSQLCNPTLLRYSSIIMHMENMCFIAREWCFLHFFDFRIRLVR